MKTMSVRELKRHFSAVLREVQQEGQVIDITNRGRVVARLVPVRMPHPRRRDVRATIARLDDLAAEISAQVPAGVSVEDVINDIRS